VKGHERKSPVRQAFGAIKIHCILRRLDAHCAAKHGAVDGLMQQFVFAVLGKVFV